MMISILTGLFFGASLYIVGANNNSNILDMLRLRDMRLGKIIFFAIGFAAFLSGLFAMFGILDISHFKIKTLHLGVITGALIFGIGFGLIGRCPGTCPVAMGGGYFKRGLITFIGGLFGAFFYSLSYGKFEQLKLFKLFDHGKITLFKISEEFPSVLDISFPGLIAMGILFMVLAYLMPNVIRKYNSEI